MRVRVGKLRCNATNGDKNPHLMRAGVAAGTLAGAVGARVVVVMLTVVMAVTVVVMLTVVMAVTVVVMVAVVTGVVMVAVGTGTALMVGMGGAGRRLGRLAGKTGVLRSRSRRTHTRAGLMTAHLILMRSLLSATCWAPLLVRSRGSPRGCGTARQCRGVPAHSQGAVWEESAVRLGWTRFSGTRPVSLRRSLGWEVLVQMPGEQGVVVAHPWAICLHSYFRPLAAAAEMRIVVTRIG